MSIFYLIFSESGKIVRLLHIFKHYSAAPPQSISTPTPLKTIFQLLTHKVFIKIGLDSL